MNKTQTVEDLENEKLVKEFEEKTRNSKEYTYICKKCEEVVIIKVITSADNKPPENIPCECGGKMLLVKGEA